MPPDFFPDILANPFQRPFFLIGLILFWGGVLAFVLALFKVGTVRRALALIALALVLAVIDACVGGSVG